MNAPFRHALRSLRRSPAFTVAAVVTLGLGIGASTALFSVVDGVLLEPLPFDEPAELLAIAHTAPGIDVEDLGESAATYLTYRADSRLLDGLSLWIGRSLAVTRGDEAEEAAALLVTEDFLDVLHVVPALGRDFDAADDAPGAPPTVIVSHGYWQRALGGDPDIVGSVLQVGGRPREVIGVLPEGFAFLDRDADILYPAQLDPAEVFMGAFMYGGVARMRPGASAEAVSRELARLDRVAVERYPGPVTMSVYDQGRFAPTVQPLKERLVGDLRPLLWTLFGTVGVVLLIACANVANLFLVRADGRVREVAVRTALGADRWRIAKVFLSEASVLAVAGGVVGVVIAWGGLGPLVTLAPGLPRAEEIGVDLPVLLFAAGASLLSGLAFAAFPVVRYGSPRLAPALKEGGRGGSPGRERHRLRNALVVGQVALALLLVVGSGLMIRSFRELRSVATGFANPEEIQLFRVALPPTLVERDIDGFRILDRILQRVRELPGVLSASAGASIPMGRVDSMDPVEVESHRTPPGEIAPVRRFVRVVPGYFETLGIPLLAGRDLTSDDIDLPRRVAVVSESIADEEWGSVRAAIGERIATLNINGREPIWYEVVGVAGDVRQDGLTEPPTPTVYWPAVQDDFYGAGAEVQTALTYAVRTRTGAADQVLSAVRDILRAEAPGVPMGSVGSLADRVHASAARTAFTLVMLAIAATIALVLGAIGLYGVVSYVVSRRTREFGIRMAVGARRGDVGRMVVGDGLLLAGAGVLLGLLGAVVLTRLMASLLYGVAPQDPVTYLLAVTVLALTAALASWIPARRAGSVDPAVTLRAE